MNEKIEPKKIERAGIYTVIAGRASLQLLAGCRTKKIELPGISRADGRRTEVEKIEPKKLNCRRRAAEQKN